MKPILVQLQLLTLTRKKVLCRGVWVSALLFLNNKSMK